MARKGEGIRTYPACVLLLYSVYRWSLCYLLLFFHAWGDARCRDTAGLGSGVPRMASSPRIGMETMGLGYRLRGWVELFGKEVGRGAQWPLRAASAGRGHAIATCKPFPDGGQV